MARVDTPSARSLLEKYPRASLEERERLRKQYGFAEHAANQPEGKDEWRVEKEVWRLDDAVGTNEDAELNSILEDSTAEERRRRLVEHQRRSGDRV